MMLNSGGASKTVSLLLLVGGFCLVTASHAREGAKLDLLSAYRLALRGDPTFLAAAAARDATLQEVPKARAGLLPSLSITATRSKNMTENTAPNSLGQLKTTDSNYRYESGNIYFRQPVFRPQNLAQYFVAESQAAAAESTYIKDTNDMIVRVSSAYFDSLLADEQLELARVERAKLEKTLVYAEQTLKKGSGTLTDVLDVKARLHRAIAQQIEAENSADYARQALQTLTGEKVGALSPLNKDRFSLQPLVPRELDAWFALADESNPDIKTAGSNVEAAKNQLLKERAGHLPTIDLVASRLHGMNDSNVSLGTDYYTNSLGFQVSVPIMAGGYVVASSTQAQASLVEAEQKLEAITRSVQLEVRKQFNNVVQGVDYVLAQQLAVESAQEAVKGNQKGVLAGTRVIVDVLNAQRDLVNASLELAKARHNWVMSLLRLKAIVGVLDDNDIEDVNRLLVR